MFPTNDDRWRLRAAVSVFLFATELVSAAEWEMYPALNTPRENYAAAVDECGRIIVVAGWNRDGGCSGGGYILDSIEALEFTDGQYAPSWSILPATTPTPRCWHAIAVANEFLYLTGGLEGTSGSDPATGRADCYDFTTGTWEQLPSLNAPRFDHRCIVDRRGRVWVIGGHDASYNSLASVEIFDPARPQLGWQPGPSLNVARGRFACVRDRHARLYVIGGYTAPNTVLSSTERLDPCGDSGWEVLPAVIPAPVPLGAGAALGGDGRIYLAGGYDWTPRLLSLAPEGTGWHTGPAMLQARAHHELVLGHDGYLYAIGGDLPGCVSTASVERVYTGAPFTINGDLNGDGVVGFRDINPFVALVTMN